MLEKREKKYRVRRCKTSFMRSEVCPDAIFSRNASSAQPTDYRLTLDALEVGTRFVRNGREEDGVLGVTSGNNTGISGGKGAVPKLEKITNFVLGDGSGGGFLLLEETSETHVEGGGRLDGANAIELGVDGETVNGSSSSKEYKGELHL